MEISQRQRYHEGYLERPEWLVARVTELLLTGHSWSSVRNMLMLSRKEFDRLHDLAVNKAQAEQKTVESEFSSFSL